MFLPRRYRSFIAVAAVFILAFLYFAQTPGWSSPGAPEDLHESNPPPVAADPPDPPIPPPPSPPQAQPGEAQDKPPWQKPDFPASPNKPDGSSEKPGFVGEKIPVDVPSKPQEQPSNDKNLPDSSKQSGSSPKEEQMVKEEVHKEQLLKEEQEEQDDFAAKFGSQGQGRVEVDLPDTDLPAVHWSKLPENFPLLAGNIISIPSARPKRLPKLQARFRDESSDEKFQRMQRLSTIKRAFEHAWNGYKAQAMGHDELKPVKGGSRDPFNGWGATLVDALDTLWIMDLKSEFAAALDTVKKIDFTTSPRKDIPVFETAIRYLGGLLGAYDISSHRHQVLLAKAVEIADIIMGAFDTPNRMPVPFYRWAP